MGQLQQELFDNMLVQFDSRQSSPTSLMFNSNLSDEQLNQLTQYVTTQPHKLASSRLSLYVDKAMLQNIHYQSLLGALKKTALQKLDMVFPVDELKTSASEIAALLNEYVADRVNYPVIICEQSSPIKPYKNKEFNSFNAKIIAHVQHHNQMMRFGAAAHQLSVVHEQTMEKEHPVFANALDKKIKLKALIQQALTKRENLDQYIKLEIQHTEVEQQEQVQEEIIDVAVQEQEQEQGLFDGQLVDFTLFQKEPYRSRISSDNLFNAFKYELFGNMPKAIKFLSHEAAMKMAENAAAFVALNADNLPQNFILKRTSQGEMVLDYDPDADEQKTNVFTPKEIVHYGSEKCIYADVDLPESIRSLAKKYSINTSSKQLDNLWVRYGDKGVRLFFDALGEPGEFSTFMINHYLNRFPHWDRLLDDQGFFDGLEKIKQYDQAEFTCLTEFLSYTDDTTQFNLQDTLKGFDAFWMEWSVLANKNKLDFNVINGRWSHRKAGNPVVYMERLLTILRNSRDLPEQLACLDGLDIALRSAPAKTTLRELEQRLGKDKQCALVQKENDFYFYGNKADGTGWGLTQLDANIVAAKKLSFPALQTGFGEFMWEYDRYEQPFDAKYAAIYQHIAAIGAHKPDRHSLDNYGAYYASKYEGFHVVSQEMGLHYDPDKQNAVTFSPDSSVYRAELERLVEYCAAKAESRGGWRHPTKEQALAMKDELFLISADDIPMIKSKSTKEDVLKKMEKQYGEIIPYNGQTVESPYKLYHCEEFSGVYYFENLTIREPHPRDEILRENITYEQIIEKAYRFIGQQPKAISLPVYATGLKKCLREVWGDMDKSNSIMTSLFFVAHERYKGDVDVYQLLNAIERMECHQHVVIENNRSLMKLFQQDTRLSDREGYAISQRVGLLNSAETDHWDKAHYIQKLFMHLQNNKQGMLKAIQHLANNPASKWPFVYALDTAEYFMKNTSIASHYHTDLLLFSTLINSEYKEVYFEGRKDKDADKINRNMELVTELLLNASTGTHPNNLDYAIKAIVQSRQYFTYAKFLAACQEIKALEAFDHKAVDAVLAKHDFTLYAALPDVFSRDSGAVKGVIIQLLLALEMAEGDNISLLPVVDASKHEITNVNNKIKAFDELETKRVQKSRLQNGTTYQDKVKNEQLDKEIALLEKQLSGASLDKLKEQQTHLQRQREKYQLMLKKSKELSQLKIKELQVRLNQTWETKGMMLSFAAKAVLSPVLLQLKNHVISEEFSALGESAFITYLEANINKLADFKDADNFEKIDRIANEARTLAAQFNQIIKRNYFITNEDALTRIFSTIDYAGYDYETLFALLDTLVNMPERDYAEVLSTYIHVSNQCSIQEKMSLINEIRTLHNNNLPSVYIAKLVSLLSKVNDQDARTRFLQQMITAFQCDEADPLLRWMMKTDTLSSSSLLTISTLTQHITTNRAAVHLLFAMMNTGEKSILDNCVTTVTKYPEDAAKKIIEILAMSYAATPVALLKKDLVDYIQLTNMLGELSVDNLDTLHTKLCKSSIAITCLNDGLKGRNQNQSFNDFINGFEKAPFGKRDLTAQFDIEHVECVVNSFTDLNNQSDYSYTYRKQMMEAFLFVNRAGNDLPVYNNKPAKDLSNDEITQLFCDIKSGEFKHLDPFQTRLYALGVMREAMYRTTGQFPYSTQMIALIDCVMHEGDVISNIDTGQGKSMVDTMKATLLWLESGRVDLTTASLIDAKRDLDIYRPFWSLLSVPFAKTPISSTSSFDTYEKQGINVGTMAQFALFYSKAKGEQVDFESEHVSLVMNESDYTILDDRTVYRYASTGGPGLIGAGKEWVYDAINQFVKNPHFKASITSETQDIAALKVYLLKQAKLQKKSSKFIEKFSDKKLLMLLESAIIVNYRLKENFDYVLTEKSEPKLINGVVRQTRSAKIIMKDGKISPDTQYGNGMQQLLYSKLNKIHGHDSFVIEPESKTIISSNNKNMIDYYRSKKGFIWGSSGTVGFGREIDLQHQKYGFEFSRVEPHQRNIVKSHTPVISLDEEAQFKHIIQLLQLERTWYKYIMQLFQPRNISTQNVAPFLCFFKDIETATRFHTYLKSKYKTQAMQLYTGLGNEEQTIHDAAKSGIITITTSALARNTDIHYDKSVGMDVIHGSIDSLRAFCQKSGRTGRQGSIGNVFCSFNQADLGEKNIDEVRALLEEKAETERQFNEELYDVLGGLLRHIGKADKAFFKDQWSEFSEQIESKYRSEKLDETYNRDRFLQDIVTQFNALSNQSLSVERLKKSIDQQHAMEKKEALDKKYVALADCISPDIIAYHFVNPTTSDKVQPYLNSDVKAKLATLFAAVNTASFATLNNDYIAYLNMSRASQAVIKEAHQAFLSEYLNAQISQSKNTPWYKRWLGFEGHLNKVVGDFNYLLLFKAMIDVRGEDTMKVDMKDSIVTLLEEYIEYSWFVSDSKRKAAHALIKTIKATESIDQIVDALSTSMIDVMKADREVNKNSFWRKIKPVNASGDSRLQNTLDRALRLTSVMASQKIKDPLIQQVEAESKNTDPANVKVATKSMKAALQHNRLYTPVSGMKGRKKPESEDNLDHPEHSPTSSKK